jgi:hypothetical protein
MIPMFNLIMNSLLLVQQELSLFDPNYTASRRLNFRYWISKFESWVSNDRFGLLQAYDNISKFIIQYCAFSRDALDDSLCWWEILLRYYFHIDLRNIMRKYTRSPIVSAGLTYRLDRLKNRASKFSGPPAKVYAIFNSVIELSHLCCHNVLYFLNNPSVIFLTQLHLISEYFRILNTPRHPRLYSNWLNTLPSSSSPEGVVLGEMPHKWNSLGPLLI